VTSATDRTRSATVTAVEEVPELSFVRPLPGFGDLRRFVLVELPADDGGDPLLFELRSIEEPAVRFLCAAPTAFFPDYVVELDEADCTDLDLRDEADALVLVLLTIGQEAAPTTANLLAPVVVNARTRAAAQVILSGSDWPVRAAVA
jgi:flagellar assembly factor FliW